MRAGSSDAQLSEIPSGRYRERMERLASRAGETGFDAALVGVGPDLEYLTGYRAQPLERLTVLVVTLDRAPILLVPRLERAAAEAGARTALEIRAWHETDDPYAMALDGVAPPDAGDATLQLAVSDRLWASHLLAFQARLAEGARFEAVGFSPASALLGELRMIKDPDEIERLRLAAVAADRVVAAIAAGPLVGRTEADVAAEVRDRLVAEGHDAASFAIVASGPNAASPHHDASDRLIRAGEPIVLDIGGTLGGYGSDITRTLWVTGGDPANGPDDRFRHLYGVLLAAQRAATAAVRPGLACEAIDEVARSRIAAEGYGAQFIHRTGHGIGLEAHESPYLVAGNREPLREGMAFSVEPGIYLDGEVGARIEDIVVCGPDGPIVLNDVPRDLLVVEG
jgi:Xaa-Pro aminopeptidase